MARIGFKKTYTPGSFDKDGVTALFGDIKSFLVDAGFQIILDTADAIDVMAMGADTEVASDDAPHWAISLIDGGSTAYIRATPVYGPDYLDESSRASNGFIFVNPQWLSSPSPEVTFWFAADGVAGWWWLHGRSVADYNQTGYDMRYVCAGVTTRRYPSDAHQGLSTRYGLWDAWGDWYPAYAINEDGTINAYPWTGTWSPFGEGWTFNGKRHPASPMPRMAVPQFPNRDGGANCIYGEFNEILVLTDGYAQEETVIPGWVAMTGDEWDQPYAVPAPNSFTVL